MDQQATGTFEITLTMANDATKDAGGPFRHTIDKKFYGNLEGTSSGQMLSIHGSEEGSAGYVAMERITGVLGGKEGTFALQHTGTMDRGAPSLSVTVVPDSGSDALEGLTGEMSIEIKDGQHFYEFRYAIG